ncbi:MAG: hypothetical protein FWE27_01715 [Defluviitaleaceae bacterium]|nr:hypothetical protein [Defluviitaleaceae bacterium]
MKKRINLMTSCDDNLAKYILPQLVAIDKNLHEYDVHFFLAHSRIFPKNIQMLKNFANGKTGITFHEVKVTKNISFYESLASLGGPWPREAYFTLRSQDYLPCDIDRIMYIDAGDVIIHGNIAPYYFDDFEGKSLIVTPSRYKINPVTNERELFTKDDMFLVSKKGTPFGSGSFVMNMGKIRNEGSTVNDYVHLREALKKERKPGEFAFFGDQGFLAAAFVGDVKYFGYPEHKDHPCYTPYDYTMSYSIQFEGEPDYEPVVLHYMIPTKPWVARFSEDDKKNIDILDFGVIDLSIPIISKADFTPQALKLAEVWWEYAKETPIYEETKTRAAITAATWVKHYLPMCAQYVKALHQVEKLKNPNKA